MPDAFANTHTQSYSVMPWVTEEEIQAAKNMTDVYKRQMIHRQSFMKALPIKMKDRKFPYR